MSSHSRSNNMISDKNWHKDIASLIDHVRLASFPHALTQFLTSLCHFDSIIMVMYKKSFKPVMVYPTNPNEHSPTLQMYLEKAYMLDPLFNVIEEGNPPGVCRLTDIAPDSFESTEYFQKCYVDFNFVDEINIIVPLDNDSGIALTIGRKTNLGSITRSELNRLHEIYPVINSLVRQFWLSMSQEFVKYETKGGAMEKALSTFGNGILTPREQEICGLILQGHSSKAISDKLNISVGTVKVHRKNIHTRLNTSTQSEIFTLFLAHLSELDA